MNANTDSYTHRVLIPLSDGVTFSQLFPTVRPYDHKAPEPARMTSRGHRVGAYMHAGAGRSAWARPGERVMELVGNHMLYLERDEITFGIDDLGNGLCLITATYNVILGKRPLAYVPTAGVPSYLLARPA